MARQMMKTRTNSSVNTESVEAKEEVTEIAKKEVEFNPEDEIECRAVVEGRTFVEGSKSKDMYQFVGKNDIQPIQYRDLADMVRTNSAYLFNPMIMVIDEDFIDKFPRLRDFYDNMYSRGDVDTILHLDAYSLKEILKDLPKGVQEAVKSEAMAMIADGRMDSISVVKTLDEFFGTKMMLTTGLYDTDEDE